MPDVGFAYGINHFIGVKLIPLINHKWNNMNTNVMNSYSNFNPTPLEELKQNVKDSFIYFEENNDRFREFMKAICETSLTADQRNKLATMQKPPLEFNETEAFISRNLGEFVKQQPSFEVHAAGSVGAENMTPDLLASIDKIESFLRYLLSPQKTDDIAFKTFDEMMKGGYSVWRVFTDYENSMSFDQEINVEKEHYPTTTFFDPMAMESHKGDGSFCGRIIPYTKKDAERIIGKDILTDLSYSPTFGNFNWSYRNLDQDIVIICEYFEKRKKKMKIVKLSNGLTITKKSYKRLLELWSQPGSGFIEQPPQKLDERTTEIEYICRYLLCEKKIISYEETDFKYLPLVFFDGSSARLEDVGGSNKRQMTRPYPYHLKSTQQLKNAAGQALAYELESTIAHKVMMAIESVDMTQLDQLRNFQIPDVLLYKSILDGGNNEQLPSPQMIQRGQVPQIIPQTFYETSRTMQNILGSYDSQMGIQGNQLSGEAIKQSALQSAGMVAPYLRGYINGLNRIAQIILDLIPKYYKTPRTIPILTREGKKEYQVINNKQNPDSIFMNYHPDMLNVSVEAGVNAEVQKQIALDQLMMMCKVSPPFAQFMNEEGMGIFLDNIDIRGVDNLRMKADEWMQNQKKQQQENPKPSPQEMAMQLKMAELQQKSQQAQAELQQKSMQAQAELQQKSMQVQQETALDAAKVEVANRKIDIDFMELLSKIKNEEITNQVKIQQSESEDVRSAALLAIELSKHQMEKEDSKHAKIERVLKHKDEMKLKKSELINSSNISE